MAILGSDAGSTPTSWRKVVGVVLALAGVLVAMLIAFALPAVHSAPHEVPIAVVGPAGGIAQFEAALDRVDPGGFDVTVASDADRTAQQVRDRQIYGAFVVGQDGLTVQTASAASYTISTVLTTVGQQLGTATGMEVTVTDLVPFPPEDPRGVGLSAGALPLALGGFIAAVGSISLLRGTRQRVVGVLLFAVVAGFAMTAVLQFWIGTFNGTYVLTALAATLGAAATSLLVLGLEELLGPPGIGLGALVVVLLGNPLSGLATAPEYLPQPWGAIGQFLPPGATGTLLRNVVFFDGAAIATPLLVLCGYVGLGLVLFFLGSIKDTRGHRAAVDDEATTSAAMS